MKILKEELMEEIKIALKDELVAKVIDGENGLVLQFLNGQTFTVVVNEQ